MLRPQPKAVVRSSSLGRIGRRVPEREEGGRKSESKSFPLTKKNPKRRKHSTTNSSPLLLADLERSGDERRGLLPGREVVSFELGAGAASWLVVGGGVDGVGVDGVGVGGG